MELGYTMDPRPLGAREKDREITGLILLNVMEKSYVLDGLLLRIFSKHDKTSSDSARPARIDLKKRNR